MPREVYQFIVKVPANTSQNIPQVSDLAMPARIVRRIQVRIPPGPRGLAGFQVAASGTQVIPWTPGEWVIGDDETLTWDVEGYIESGAWQVIMYNAGQYLHGMWFRFEVDPISVVSVTPAGSSPLDTASILGAAVSGAGSALAGGVGGLPGIAITPAPLPVPSAGPGAGTLPTAVTTAQTGAAGTVPPVPAPVAADVVDTAAGTLPRCGYDPAATFPGSDVPVPAGALGGWCFYQPGHAQTGLPSNWSMTNPALPGVIPLVPVAAPYPPAYWLSPAGLPLTVTAAGITWYLVRDGGTVPTPWYFTYARNGPIPGSAMDPTQASVLGVRVPSVPKPATGGASGVPPVGYLGPPVKAGA